ncbi:MAG: site-2 protease family protein [Christensenellales bacterium]|jgi:membrane-associated protease RseP (regulator of RpoE activity)
MSMVLAFFSDMLFFILLLWLACAASVFIHEMGHATGYMLAAKSTGWQITIGSGKNIVRSKRWVVNLLPLGGLFLPVGKDRLDTKRKKIAMLAGGPLATLLLLVPLVALRMNFTTLGQLNIGNYDAVECFVRFVLYYNLIMLVVAIFPSAYPFGICKGLASDGLQIYRLLK